MSDSSKIYLDLFFRNAKVPWLTFIFLAVVFFILQHDLLTPLREENFNIPTESIVRATSEGDLKRRVVLLILGLFGVVGLIRQGRKRLKVQGLLGWLILFYLAWVNLSIIWAEDTILTLRRLVALAMICLSTLALSRHFLLRDVIRWVFFSAALYLFVGLLVEIALGTFHPFTPEYRFAGTLHPNHQGINCALLLLSGTVAAYSEKRGRNFFLMCAFIGLIFLVLTRSRTAFVSAIIAFFAFKILVSSTSRKVAFILSVSFVFCLLLLFLP